jgi:hypothetical protein
MTLDQTILTAAGVVALVAIAVSAAIIHLIKDENNEKTE